MNHKSLFRIFLFCVIAVLAVLPAHAARADSGWVINDFSSRIGILSDGRIHVEENIKATFSDQKHGIYRDLPVVYQDQSGQRYTIIDVLSVSQDGQTAVSAIERNGANLRIRIGDANKLIEGEHNYQIVYLATGVLNSFSGYDELYWNVTGNDWAVPIQRSSAVVDVPAPILQSSCYAGGFGGNTPCDQKTNQGQKAEFYQNNLLEAGQGLTVAVGFEKGAVPILTVAAPPSLLSILRMPLTSISFLVFLALGLAAIIGAWWKKGRDQWYERRSLFDPNQQVSTMPLGGQETIVVEYDPPQKLRPGEMGVLKDETADTLDVSASIVDLAVRGYLTITEIPKKHFWQSTDYELKRIKTADEQLLKYEKLLLEFLFEGGPSVLVSSLKNSFYSHLRKIKDALYQNAVAKNMFTANPATVRAVGVIIGVLVLLASVVIFGAMGAAMGNPGVNAYLISVLMALASALAICGVVLIPVAVKAMPRRSAQGRELYRQIRGYEEFLSNVEKYRQQYFERQNVFMDVLPYAMVFGLTDKLAKAMAKMGVQPPPPNWYYGVNPVFNMSAFSNSMSAFSTALSTNMASTPHSSGSGGGGFSGGGFGGGGGGSW